MAKSKRRGRPQRNASARVSNAVSRRQSGLNTEYDFGTAQMPVVSALTPFQQDRYAVNLYYSDWAAKKIIAIPVDDILREGWEFDGLDDDQRDRIETAQDELHVIEQIKTAMRLERLVGGAVIFMGIAEDGNAKASDPVDFDKLKTGALRFLNVIPRTRITQTTLDYQPLSSNYGRPEKYFIEGEEVHRSRLLIFPGDPLTQVPDPTITPQNWIRNDGFGVSVLMNILDDLMRATGSRQAAYQMVQRASVFIMQKDLMDTKGTEEGQAVIEEMRQVINQINLFRGAVIDRGAGEGDPITTLTTQFGSVPELVMSFIQILSAASDIPATRFLGQAPGGLNATGESDLENYYGRLESEQKQKLRPILLQLLRVMGPSALGDTFNRMTTDVTFPPLWSLSEKEEAEIRTADIGNVLNLLLNNLVTDAEALEELDLRNALKAKVVREAEEEVRADEKSPTVPLAETLAAMVADDELPAV